MLARFISTCTVSIVTLCFRRLLASWVGFSLLVLVSRKQFWGEKFNSRKDGWFWPFSSPQPAIPFLKTKPPKRCLVLDFWYSIFEYPKGPTCMILQLRQPTPEHPGDPPSQKLIFTSKSPRWCTNFFKRVVPVPGHTRKKTYCKHLEKMNKKHLSKMGLVFVWTGRKSSGIFGSLRKTLDLIFFGLCSPANVERLFFFFHLTFLPQTTGFCESFPMRSSLDVPSVGGPHSRIGFGEIFRRIVMILV